MIDMDGKVAVARCYIDMDIKVVIAQFSLHVDSSLLSFQVYAEPRNLGVAVGGQVCRVSYTFFCSYPTADVSEPRNI